jgi:hypothetical protein
MRYDLDSLEALATAATPGPWHWVNPTTDAPRGLGEWRSSLRTVEKFPTQSVGPLPKFIVEADEICDWNMDANASFIAAANPETILTLTAELRKLRAEINEMRKQRFELMGVIIDIEQGGGFDETCLNTIKRVSEALSAARKERK